ncbi:hypothetical protein DINM_001817 [Dirofilaria immitis]|nr:hypothetical protein [Dirofilaria immitis]
MSMAVAQKYYELCTILFPIAMFMFDDTKRKGIAGFIWTNKERQILRNVLSLNGAAMIWLYITASADNKLFYELFEKSAKEEIFLTEIEKGLDCISDDDKELDPTIECDNTINRSVISRKWLKPLLIIWIVGHVIVLFLFGFINKDFKDDENEGNLKNVAIKEKLIS